MPNWKILGFLVNHAGLVILDPNLTPQGNWTASYVVTRHLITALRGHVKFLSGDHAQILTNSRAEIRRRKGQDAEESLSAAVGGISLMEGCPIRHRRKTGGGG